MVQIVDAAMIERMAAIYSETHNYSEVARRLGVSERTVRRYLKRDPAIAKTMTVAGTTLVPSAVWLKTGPDEDGVARSILLRPEPEKDEDFLERVRAAFEAIQPAEPIAPPQVVHEDLCTLYPLMDLHLGMHAWSPLTGSDDYDLKLACDDLRYGISKLLALNPPSKQAVLVLGGDTLHADDDLAQTPQHKHVLDVDGRQDKVLDVAIGIIAELVERLAEKHERVLVRTLRGNHDINSHRVLKHALNQRYRDEPRIEVDMSPFDLFMYQWGKAAIFAHHGDKYKPEQAALYISDVCPFWSETRHRYYFTGHIHKDQARDIGPLRWESLRAFCPPDAYAASMGYASRRALQAFTIHKQDGIVLRAIDPIQRQS